MCFTTTKFSRAKIAKTDIECWKMLWDDYTNLYKYALEITITYQKNTKMPLVPVHRKGNSIKEGYYSFQTSEHLAKKRVEYGEPHLKGSINVKCIIPKGTRYYKNETEYVSETIMLVE